MRAAPFLLILVMIVPSAIAYWDTPSGLPYDAKQTILLEQPMQRAQLHFVDGMVVWAERAWEEHEWHGSPGRVTIYEFDPDDPKSQPTLSHLGQSNRSTDLDASDRFVVWTNNGRLNAYDRASKQTMTIASEGGPQRPHVEGDYLVWVQHGNRHAEWDWYVYQLNLTARFAPPQPSGPNMPPFPPIPAMGFRAPGCSPPTAWAADRRVLVFTETGCMDDNHTGLQLYDPASREWTPIDRAGRVAMLEVDGARVVYAATHDSTNLYLTDLTTILTRRITWSLGREAYPSLSGNLVAWADVRSEERQYRDARPAYDVYFQNLLTLNEYRLEGSWGFSAGPAVEGRWLVYNDFDGKLVLAELPTGPELLEVAVVVDIVGDDQDTLQLTLEGQDTVSGYWHRDLDGASDGQGTLSVPLATASADPGFVVGVGVDDHGRTATVGFALQEAAAFAATGAGPVLFRARSSDSAEWPIPSASLWLVMVGAIAALAMVQLCRRA